MFRCCGCADNPGAAESITSEAVFSQAAVSRNEPDVVIPVDAANRSVQKDSQRQAGSTTVDSAAVVHSPPSSPQRSADPSPAPAGPNQAAAVRAAVDPGLSVSLPVEATPTQTTNLSEGMFEIELTKTVEQSKIGLDVDRHGGQSLRILKIKPGLINDWNGKRAEIEGKPQIKPGFRIIEVNGIAQDPMRMMETVANSTTLKLILKPM
eukprot:CAMPEP_0170618778 /NCGR_PEP_ID=MMETSP0224-20130122/27143_1 /TAXON_ID=285029 /ORGANISM="Togula jolla, Strain CCCM 725" /LENGTH=207 /DNA_ID=CAMNT_0010944781 /DNA_START=48 /DNA_END=671 /DNA_ORIENTATION=+